MRRVIGLTVTAASLLISCFLPYSTYASLNHASSADMMSEQNSFDMAAAAPIDFVDLSLSLSTAVQRVGPEKLSDESYGLSFRPPELKSKAAQESKVQLDLAPSNLIPAAPPHVIRSLPAHRLDPHVDRISFDKPTLAPMAFVRFCLRYAGDCKAQRVVFRPKPIALTKARRGELIKVNRDVNRAIRPQEDHRGVVGEEWLVSPRAGDCNDYAVTKRHKLLALGWPVRSLLLAEVAISSGEHHLVLVVRTLEGDFVLDNLNGTVLPLSQVGYQWVRAQQSTNPKFWSEVSVKRPARVAMNAQ